MNKDKIFCEFIDAETERLRNVVWKIVKNEHDTRDVIQEALKKAWNHYDKYRGESKLSTWIYSIAIHEAYRVRHKNIQRAMRTSPLCYDAPYPQETSHINEDDLQLLENAIAQLPEVYRNAITLTIVQGLTPQESAEISGCSVNTFYGRIRYAKQSLTEWFRRNYE